MSIDWIPSGSTRTISPKELGNRGIFPSFKVPGGIVEYESCLERDFFLECHHSPDVVKLQHQPITIHYQDQNGAARRYTPDVYVEFRDGYKGLFEIKYESEVQERGHEYEERWAKAKEWANERGIIFSVLTERNIRSPRWFNVWFTWGSSKSHSIESYLGKLKALIPEAGERYDQLCYKLSETEGIGINKAAQILCNAIYHGLVFLDSFSSKQISNNSLIRPTKGNRVLAFEPLREALKLGEAPKEQHFAGDAIERDPISLPQRPSDQISHRIPEKYEKITKLKLSVVKAWLNQPKLNRTPEWRDAFCKTWNVNEKTAYKWAATFRIEGIEGLIPKYQKSGRQLTYSPETLDLMEKARQIYLQPLSTLKLSYAELVNLCKAQNFSVPPEPAFRTYVYRNTTVSEFARKRGRTYFKANFTPSLESFQGAFAPMQIIQVDNTSFDVFPVDSEHREGLSTPFMTTAIDCYTRMITGFNLSYFPSSSRTILEVLVQTILPKDAYTATYGTQQTWPIHGFPVMILVDNGLDYRSDALKAFCKEYDIIVEYVPIRTPRFKAFIEQWFNLLHKALVAEKVGGLRPLLKERLENPDLKPEAKSVLSLQELETWLHKWVIDEYHFTNSYDEHAPAPYLRWQDYQAGQTKVLLPLPREPPVDKKEVDLVYLSMLEREDRKLTSKGIVWEHLRYNNKALGKLHDTIGDQKVDVLLNSRDIRCVWVIPPDSSTPIKVELASGWAQTIANVHGDKPIHASAWKKDVSLLKNHLKLRISPFLYQREMSRLQREELLRTAEKNTKTARKEQEKVKETERKSIDLKMQPPSHNASDNKDSEDSHGEPASKKKKVEIDWKNLKNFPTYDFPKER